MSMRKRILFANFAFLKNKRGMSTLDIVMIVVIVVSAAYGYYKGILSQMGALAGVLVGIICCRLFAEELTSFMNTTFLDPATSKASSRFMNSVIAQVVLFLAGYFGARWVASLIATVLKTIKLGAVNRFAGAVFAVVQWLVVLSLMLNVWIAIFPETELLKSSSGIADERLINLAPDIFGSETAQEMFESATELINNDK